MAKRWGLAVVVWVLVAGRVGAQAGADGTPKPSQGQVAGWFLRAVVRADYVGAYHYLTPEMRRAVSLEQFKASAGPLHRTAGTRRPDIRLYKLGVRLGEGQSSQLFYSFAFEADSSLKTPPVLLEVTFRDTASRAVLGFGVRANGLGAKRAKAVAPGVRRGK